MRTCKGNRDMFVSWLHDPTSDRMSVRAWAVGEDMAKDCDELEARCAALQAENDANAKWLEETWPTIEDRALGDLVRERDEARAALAAMHRRAQTSESEARAAERQVAGAKADAERRIKEHHRIRGLYRADMRAASRLIRESGLVSLTVPGEPGTVQGRLDVLVPRLIAALRDAVRERDENEEIARRALVIGEHLADAVDHGVESVVESVMSSRGWR